MITTTHFVKSCTGASTHSHRRVKMLTNITIKNYIIIDLLELDFSEGLTALTGETGAGKSILLGALGLVLGDRADTGTIKQDSDFSEIVAEFNIQNSPGIIQWLEQQDLDAATDGLFECNLRRRITKDGRSRAHVNGTPVNLSVLRELSEMLIDIHGQHEHQSLMRPTAQRQLLDDYANHPELLKQISETYHALKKAQNTLEQLEANRAERADRLSLLNFQAGELNALALEKNEYQELGEQHKRLANSEQLILSTRSALDSFQDNENYSIQSELARALSSLQDCNEIDENITVSVKLFEEAQIQIDEGISELRNYASTLNTDSAQLQSVETRIQTILDIARKHHVNPESLDELHQKLLSDLDGIEHADEKLDDLNIQITELKELYDSLSIILNKNRNTAAKTLNKKITAAMQTLGMKGGKFLININPIENRLSNHGSDKIEFTVSANVGNNCKPLTKVASGGELARISLAIQIITKSQNTIHTLIFDEVDSGVGGGIAEIVGQHLRKLGSTNQVICITHLPQVASQAHHHLKVHKTSEKESTNAYVNSLNKVQRIEEIARMLSGVDVTKQSLANAEEMIERVEA